MGLDAVTQSSRRTILAASLGGLAAAVLGALGRPELVRAGVDGDVVLNTDNTETGTTKITCTSDNVYAFEGIAAAAGVGVSGESPSGVGVFGTSTSGIGVYCSNNSISMPAAAGQSWGNGTGVQGYSGSASRPAAPAKTGVYGYAGQDANARGVYGATTVGYGVYGVATTGTGVRGIVTSAGTGGFFATGSPSSGTGLRAQGRVRFDHAAGIATIASGASSVLVTPGTDLQTTSAVVATLMGNAGGSTTVKRVSLDSATNKFTIYLTANSTASVQVAWHVFG